MIRYSLATRSDRQMAQHEALRVLAAGGVVALPTETSYGFAADATNPEAIARVFQVKGRDERKTLSVFMASQVMARRYAILTLTARRLWTQFLPGPLTIVLPARDSDTTWGIRVSAHPFAQSLVRAFGKPITATSANRSGESPLYDPDAIMQTFAHRKYQPDLLIDGGILPVRPSSTVVDCTGDDIRILREGAIRACDLSL